MAPTQRSNAGPSTAPAPAPGGDRETKKERLPGVRGAYGSDRVAVGTPYHGRVTLMVMGGKPSKSGKCLLLALEAQDANTLADILSHRAAEASEGRESLHGLGAARGV